MDREMDKRKKKVTFKEKRDKKSVIKEFLEKMRMKANKEKKTWREDWEIRMMAVENRTKEIEKCLREIKEDLEEYKRKECKGDGDEESIEGISYKSNGSGYRNSVVSSKWGSEGSLSGKGSA